MKSLYLSIIVIVASLVLPAAFGSGINTMPDPKFHAVLDKNNYQSSEKPLLSIFTKPNATVNLLVLDSHGLQKLDKNITLENGTITYSFDISTYSPGICSVIVEEGTDEIKLDFSVGLTPTGGSIVLNTDRTTYLPGDNVTIFGAWHPNTMIQLSLVDPNGVSVKSMQIFSDKTGHFSLLDFIIPRIATTGTWKIYGTSGVNDVSVNLTVENIPGTQIDKAIVLSPLKQFKSGITAKDVKCKQDLSLVFKLEDGTPACVKPDTGTQLLKRGWGTDLEVIKVKNANASVAYGIDNGSILSVTAYGLSSTSSSGGIGGASILIVSIDTTSNGTLIVTMPRILIDAKSDNHDDDFTILSDGQEIKYAETSKTMTSRTLSIPYQWGVKHIEIIGYGYYNKQPPPTE